jgi:multiple sugar transport system substrate-binding protein
MKSRFFIAVVLPLLIIVLPAHAEVQIRFDGYPDLDSHLENVLPQFLKENPEIKVNMLINIHADHHTKLKTNLANRSGAGDTVAVDVGFIGALVDSGGFVNLDEAPYNAEKYANKFAPYAWAQGKGADGNQYGIPLDLGPGVMYYRRDLMEDLGFDVEDVIKSWDTYIRYGIELQKKVPDAKLISTAASIAELIVRTTIKNGESIYFDKNGNSVIQGRRFVTAFTLAKKIRDLALDKSLVPWTNEWTAGFKDGTVATELSGAWLLGHLKSHLAPKTAGNWGVSFLPAEIYGSWGGSFLSIPAQSQHKEEAWKLIEFLSTPYAQIEGLKKIASFPALIETYNDGAFNQPDPFLDGQIPGPIFTRAAKKITPVVPSKGDLIGWSVVFENAIFEVLDNGKDVKQALAEADNLIQRRMRKLKYN